MPYRARVKDRHCGVLGMVLGLVLRLALFVQATGLQRRLPEWPRQPNAAQQTVGRSETFFGISPSLKARRIPIGKKLSVSNSHPALKE